MCLIQFNPDAPAFISDGGHSGSSTAQKRIKHEVAFIGGGEEAAFHQCHGLLRGVFAVRLLRPARCRHGPHRFHLLAAVGAAHEVVVEAVFAFLIARGPEEGLGGVGEVAAGKVGRRVGLFPGDVVEDFEPQLLQRVPNGEDDVQGAADPEGAMGLEDALAASKPFAVEFVVEGRPAGFIPIALVHLHHPARVAGDAAVGEEVGRVGKDAVEAALGIFGGNGIEEFEAVAVVEPKPAVIVAVDEAGRGGWRCSVAL